MSFRILLSPPDVGPDERARLLAAFDSGWIAPVGPDVDAFEAEMAAALAGDVHAVALASGTAALHLALLLSGVEAGDEVLVPTLTFAATANAVRYVGARPVFVDADEASWNLDPGLVVDHLDAAAAAGRLPAAIVTVDLYGQCADHDPIVAAARAHGVPVIEDAAEALGATYRGRAAGTLGDLGVLSFNGNKIITTSGGGMLLAADGTQADRARYLATQARQPAAHYEHVEVGYNYRLSNLLAAVGRAQLAGLDTKVARRREIFARYHARLADLPGVAFQPEADHGTHTRWLTCLTIDPEVAGTDREAVRTALVEAGIEARPVWKPMHLQPAYAGFEVLGSKVAEGLFATGLCLPSGSSLTDAEVEEVAGRVATALGD
jgi:dTDP-4-amino-4,6-dideoxygalactose transaminase